MLKKISIKYILDTRIILKCYIIMKSLLNVNSQRQLLDSTCILLDLFEKHVIFYLNFNTEYVNEYVI